MGRAIICEDVHHLPVELKVESFPVVNGYQLTQRQIEVLEAIRREGSKNAAAKKLGISVPVVHNYIKAVEESTGVRMLESVPTGSRLTGDALRILDVTTMHRRRNTDGRKFTVACSPVTEELIMSAFTAAKIKGDILVADDQFNMRMLRSGMVEMIIVDDPVNLFDLEEYNWVEIGHMDMIHVDRGPNYARYSYGAQRIAYDYLDTTGKQYEVVSEYRSLSDLIASGKSFFVDEFLLMRKGIKLQSSTDPAMLRHSITAVLRKETRCGERLLRAIRRKNLI